MVMPEAVEKLKHDADTGAFRADQMEMAQHGWKHRLVRRRKRGDRAKVAALAVK